MDFPFWTCSPSKEMQEMRQPEQYLVPRGVARPEFLKLSYCSTIDLQCELFLSHQWKQADSYWHSNRVQVHGLRRFSSIVLFRFQLESSGSARHVSIPNAKVRATACCYSLSGWLHTDRIQEVKSRSLKETDSLKQSPLDLQGIKKAAICKEWHRPYCSSRNCVPSFWAFLGIVTMQYLYPRNVTSTFPLLLHHPFWVRTFLNMLQKLKPKTICSPHVFLTSITVGICSWTSTLQCTGLISIDDRYN